jgi:adenylate cyclase
MAIPVPSPAVQHKNSCFRMGVNTTVVFTDLTGSTAVFEALGNTRATRAVTQLTQWIRTLFEERGGKVIKTLGDGVLTTFEDPAQAIQASVELQRKHQAQLLQQPLQEQLPIRVGISTGEVEVFDGDCFGDAVNVASRLCDLAGPHEIWLVSPYADATNRSMGMRFRPLGPINVRGRSEPCSVFQVEWLEDQATDFITMQADFDSHGKAAQKAQDVLGQEIRLAWKDQARVLRSFELPAQIGRIRHCEFVVSDPRVSRTHARLEWRNGRIVVVDVSSYGTWIRFGSDRSDLLLRREECILYGRGQIALGASFEDEDVPVVSFDIS